ncbi:MAG TPA: aldose 1-epimerase family protein [Jatrophihabitantaceae bacterium]|nr:aldose 1-epimerase family protein [Jatrophihabitantaceae bacterium]
MALTGRQFQLVAGNAEATVVEVGAGLRRYTVKGRDITVPYGEDEVPPKGCGAVLVPWPNRIRGGRYVFDGVEQQLALTEPVKGNASHGLGRWARWVPVRQEISSVTLGLDVVPQPGWPFELHVEVTYTLDPKGNLTVAASATNTGARRLPFGAGFHPYLDVGGNAMSRVAVKLAATHRLVTDEAAIPIGRQAVSGTRYDLHRGHKLGDLRLDDAFTGFAGVDGHSWIEVTSGRQHTKLWVDAAFGYVQVFTADLLTGGRGGVAIEPMTCPANAFNTGESLVILEPGGTWYGSWGIVPG